MPVDLQKFRQLLESHHRTWANHAEDLGSAPGLRSVRFSGTLIRHALLNDGAVGWMDRLFSLLPDDAALVDLGYGLLWPDLLWPLADRYHVVVASKEWAPLDGEDIPELHLTLGPD